MAQQGWYPDPGGAPGMYRYWDGAAWSEVISPTPLPGPPASTTTPQPPQSPQQPWGSYTSQASQNAYTLADPTVTGSFPLAAGPNSPQAQSAYDHYQSLGKTSKKRTAAIAVSVVVGVLVIALVIYFIVTRVFSGTSDTNNNPNPNGNPTTQLCPDPPQDNTRADHPNDDRVYGGSLSYPLLTGDWSEVTTDDTRIPFGRDVAEQMVVDHANYDGPGTNWVTSVMVGELYAGDGFYDPEQASTIVNRCIFGTFYGDTAVTADVQRSESYTLDGYDGWITETNLSFSIPNLPVTSELAVVIIVKTSPMSSSIFYASIPNDAQQYLSDVQNAMNDLQVST